MKSLTEFMFQQEVAISSRNLWDKCPTSGGVQGNTMLLEESGDDRDTQNNTIRFDVKIKKALITSMSYSINYIIRDVKNTIHPLFRFSP